MYLDIVLIDCLDAQGVLTTYRITPLESHGRVVIDRLTDIDQDFPSPDSISIGGTRVYNMSSCRIEMQKAKLRHFTLSQKEQSISFRLEHMGLPVGLSRAAHGGHYNLLLPAQFRFTELYVSDPYDSKVEDVTKKKQFSHNLSWDTKNTVSLVSMSLRSSRGTFSFILGGTARLASAGVSSAFLPAHDTEFGVAQVSNVDLIPQESQKGFANGIAEAIRATDRQVHQVFVEKLSMGDTNINYGKAGIVGSGKARDITQNDWHAHKDSIDLSALAKELAKLRAAMRREGTTTEQDKAIVAVGSAEEAAKQNDGESVFGYLRQAGKWALDTATKLGTTVAVDAIKKAIGM